MNYIDAQTVRVVFAVLLITPQSEKYVDIYPFLQVEFTTSQYGLVKGKAQVDSTSETFPVWHTWVGIVLIVAFAYLMVSFAMIVTSVQKSLLLYFDVFCAAAVMGYLMYQYYIDISPPNVAEELEDAFGRNAQLMYFR